MDLPGLASVGKAATVMGGKAVDFALDKGNDAIELVTGTDYKERNRVRDEQASGNAERDQIYQEQNGLCPRWATRLTLRSWGRRRRSRPCRTRRSSRPSTP
ncbi:hypothetical protein P9209_23385 [Prescottella defluvii]|nr:hypothetical protein P9209_23385 [Prescottella defluvii]